MNRIAHAFTNGVRRLLRADVLLVASIAIIIGVGASNLIRAQDETPTSEFTLTPVPTLVLPQEPTDPVDTGDEPTAEELQLALVLGLFATIRQTVELLKPFLSSFKLADDKYNALVQGIAMLLGVIVAVLSNEQLNLFTGVALIPPLLGVIMTGAVAGLGAGAINAVFGLFYGWRNQLNARAISSGGMLSLRGTAASASDPRSLKDR